MQYDDARIQYDQSNVLYDGSWTLTINETASFSESISKFIQTAISEISTITESIAKSIYTDFSETITTSETLSRNVGISISETITMSESLFRTIRTVISETITITESYGVMFRLVISETITMTESLTFNIYERLKGILGMIKEFVRISDKKEKVSATNVLEGVREQLNVIERKYDDVSIMYDAVNVCYNNYISSEKPLFVLGKKNAQVSISNHKDKPIISKR